MRAHHERVPDDHAVVHARLQAWGRWARDATNAWPTVSILGRLIDEGPSAGETGGDTAMPAAIAEVDDAVMKLAHFDRRIIVTYYTRWEPIESMAKREGLTVEGFQTCLHEARAEVLRRLG